MHAISWCNMGLAQKFKKCIMHAFITMPTLINPNSFDPSPTQHIDHCSTFPSLWSKHCSSPPSSLLSPSVWKREEILLLPYLVQSLHKNPLTTPPEQGTASATLSLTLHHPSLPTRGLLGAPIAQTDLHHYPR
jgi:hypothetical protein